MFGLPYFVGKAPSPKKEEERKPQNSIMLDMRKMINEQQPFSFVYIELARQNGLPAGDVNYISDLVGGMVMTKRCVGVLVPFGKAQAVYNKLEELAEAPFQSAIRIGHASFPGHSEHERHVLGDILVEAQKYRVNRVYAGKQSPAPEGEKVLECA